MAYDELATLVETILTAETDEQRREALALVDLVTTEQALRAAANEMLASDDASPEANETLQAIADALDAIRSEVDFRAAEAAEQEAARATLRARVNGETAEVEAAEEVADVETLATEEVEVAETVVEPEIVPEPAAVPVPARPSLGALRNMTPAESRPAVQPTQRISVRSGMDVPNRAVGSEFRDLAEVAEALIARQSSLGNGRSGNANMERLPIAQFKYLDELRTVGEDKMLNGLLLMDAGRSDALTASGGFCAPSEVVYDFVKVNRPNDLVQDFLPVVGAPRGSIEYPASPDIRDAFSGNVTRAYSNADDIAGTHKVTAVIACPSFNTCTVGAQYVILQFGNFGTRAYPEWVAHWIGLSMDAHAHKVSSKLMNQMVSLSNAVVAVGPNGGATGTLFGNFAMAAADMRQDLRMGREAPLEIVVPSWTYDLIRSDLARARKSSLETLNVSNAMIDSWFATQNLIPHPVVDWFDISGNAATGTTVWPSGLDFLLYPPGTFVKLDMGTLDLGIVRDSTLNATNDYNIFVESFESVCKPGIESRLYSVSICANGAFSADQNLNCAGIDIPGS